MNAKVIEGLKALKEGIDLILEGIDTQELTTPVKQKEEPKKVEAPVEEAPAKTEKAPVEGTFTAEQLEGMTYNNLKKLAKELGLSASGNREEITNRILGEKVEVPAEAITEEAPEEVPVDEKDNDPVYAKVVDAVADMTTEEIADVLADIGLSAKGKREALIDKVVQAVKDGLLDFDDDDEEVEEPKAEVVEIPVVKESVPADEEDEEDDNTNDVDNPDMTKARKEAIIAQDEDVREQFDKGKVTREELVEFLQAFYDTEEDLSDMSDDEVLDTYIDALCRLIDDDGNIIEEGAYLLNGEPACCGRALVYSEDTGLFICEHCGEEYEAE